ncbi:MAG: hypothetical protein WC773_04775 [Patescibacteria group bacterium]|jgi:O-antigen/teichoic acid export membrane protein
MKAIHWPAVEDFLQAQFKFDVAHYLRSGWWSVFSNIVQAASGLILAILFAHLASKEVFGEFQLVVSIISMTAVISLKGLDTVIVRDAAQGKEGILRRASRLRWQWSWLALPVLSGLGCYYWQLGQTRIGFALVLSGLLAPWNYLAPTWEDFVKGRQLWKQYSLFTSLRSGAVLCFVGLSIWLSQGNLLVVFSMYLLINLILNQGLIWFYKRNVKNDNVNADWKSYGMFLSKLSWLKTIVANLDKVLVGIIISPSALAVYSIALIIPNYLQLAVKGFFQTTSPRLSGRKQIYWHELAITGVFGLVFALITVVAVKLLLIRFFGESYQPALPLAYIAATAMIFHPIALYLVNFANMNNRKDALVKCNLICPIVRLILLLWLGSQWHETGFALAYAIMGLVWVIVPIWLLKINWHQLTVGELN